MRRSSTRQELALRRCYRSRAAAVVQPRWLLWVGFCSSPSLTIGVNLAGAAAESLQRCAGMTQEQTSASTTDPDSLHCAPGNPVGGFVFVLFYFFFFFVQGFNKWVWIACRFFLCHMLLKAHLSKWFFSNKWHVFSHNVLFCHLCVCLLFILFIIIECI